MKFRQRSCIPALKESKNQVEIRFIGNVHTIRILKERQKASGTPSHGDCPDREESRSVTFGANIKTFRAAEIPFPGETSGVTEGSFGNWRADFEEKR